MSKKDSIKKVLKPKLHPRNRNISSYDLQKLASLVPGLGKNIIANKYGGETINFSNPKAVRQLNTAILKHYYGIDYWMFSAKNLCPPIPGRADYIHFMADLLAESNSGIIPSGPKVKAFDIGTGASCIYPIIGVVEYNWKFIASDIDEKSLAFADKIVELNPTLKSKVELRFQEHKHSKFYGIIDKREKIDVSICNPPFHSSKENADKGSLRKIKNLGGKKTEEPILNFSGNESELITDGGEYRFIQNMIRESKKFADNCLWFSSLVSKKTNLKAFYKSLDKMEAKRVKTIEIGTGNKISRILAWTFKDKEEQEIWAKERWGK